MGRLVLVGIVCFVAGAIIEGAVRDNNLVEKLQATNAKLHTTMCLMAKQKEVKIDDC